VAERRLYIWLERDPLAGPPDTAIEDVPGRADLDLLAEAIRQGKLGRYLPTKLALSRHRVPLLPSGYRRVNVANLLRQYRIPYRTRLEVLTDASSLQDSSSRIARSSREHEPCT
jgi:hypothetical protein